MEKHSGMREKKKIMDEQQIRTEQRSAHYNLLTNFLPQQPGNTIREMHRSDAPLFFRKRYWLTFLFGVGMVLFMILRANLSIALVEMTSEKKIQLKNETIIQKAEFDWDMKTKGFILSVFSIGYLCGWLGGILALKFGATTIFGVGITVTAILAVLSPILIRIHLSVYIVARLLEGVFESFSMASSVAIFILWAPPHERARLSNFCGVGLYFGIAINYPLSGFFTNKYGWESVFYVTGGLTLIWSIIWFIFISNDPTKDRLMMQAERDLFKRNLSETVINKKVNIPWKKIVRSKPVWAYFNEFFSFYWAQSFVSYCMPLYIKDLYNVNIQDIGLISGIPMTGAFLGFIFWSLLLDSMRNNTSFSIASLHRIFIATGQISFVICLVYCGLLANFEQSIISFTVARLFAALTEVSYQVLVIDMFSEFAGVIRGFSVTATSIALFLNPIVMGFMVADHSRSSWNFYFLFLSIFNIWSLVIYYLYGSGKLQEWATPTTTENEINETKSKNTGDDAT